MKRREEKWGFERRERISGLLNVIGKGGNRWLLNRIEIKEDMWVVECDRERW